MKFTHFAIAGALSLAVAAPAFADSIDFAQFGPRGTAVANGSSGLTNGGVGFTISGPSGSGFTEYLEDTSHAESFSWAGEFATGEIILFDNGVAGPVTITFATGISSIQHLEAQANNFGNYVATLTAFSGLTNLGSVSYNSTNNLGPENSIPYLDFFGSNITSIVISTTNDGAGFALGGTGGMNNAPPGVPEPATWAMMLMGFGGLGAVLRANRRRYATAA